MMQKIVICMSFVCGMALGLLGCTTMSNVKAQPGTNDSPQALAYSKPKAEKISAAKFEPRNALDIINRPNRVQEEHDAWHPPQTEPLDALLTPAKPLDQLQAVLRRVWLPGNYEIGDIFWMDNRFAMTTLISDSSKSIDGHEYKIIVVDASNGQYFVYKESEQNPLLHCYRDNRIIYSTGLRNKSRMKSGMPLAKYWFGDLGVETSHEYWAPPRDDGSFIEYTYSVYYCDGLKNQDDMFNKNNEEARSLGGIFQPAGSQRKESVWSPFGLLREHGFFAINNRDIDALPPQEQAWYEGIWWFKRSGERIFIPDVHRFYEIGSVGADQWVPWLGAYVLNGAGVYFDKASSYSYGPDEIRYRKKGSVVVFDPANGRLIKVPRPAYLTNLVGVRRAHATRWGLLWQTGPSVRGPWGLYISQGATVKTITDEHIRDLKVSPNGCRVLYVAPRYRENFATPKNLGIVDLCQAP
jgi:hypothetical protein